MIGFIKRRPVLSAVIVLLVALTVLSFVLPYIGSHHSRIEPLP